jgi:SAM-dependent methyltransferase
MVASQKNSLMTAIATYYSDKIREHGDTPQGVDWNSEEGQLMRFQQLSKILSPEGEFSVNDLGCGYGAFFNFLRNRFSSFSYSGIDVSNDMIKAAQSRYDTYPNARFVLGDEPLEEATHSIASGIFNVRVGASKEDWWSYLVSTLDLLNRFSTTGFAFNCLTSYSDSDKMRPHLYYADPCRVFDHCKRAYSRHVALLHDYGLYEFTILVRKHV